MCSDRGLSKVQHVLLPSESLTAATKCCISLAAGALLCCGSAFAPSPVGRSPWRDQGPESRDTIAAITWILLVSRWGLPADRLVQHTPISLSVTFMVSIFLSCRIVLLPGLLWSDIQDSLLPFVLSCLFPCLGTPQPPTGAVLRLPRVGASLEPSLLSMSPALLRFWEHGLRVVLLVELTGDSLPGGQGGIRDVVA